MSCDAYKQRATTTPIQLQLQYKKETQEITHGLALSWQVDMREFLETASVILQILRLLAATDFPSTDRAEAH